MEKERVIYILSFFRTIDEEIKFNEKEIGEQEDIYYSTIAAQNLDGLPRGKGGFHSATETAALNVPEGVCETLEFLRKENEGLRRLKKAIMKEITALPYLERAAIHNHHVKGLQWVQISEQLHYSVRQCQNFRDKGIKKLAKRFERNGTISNFHYPE